VTDRERPAQMSTEAKLVTLGALAFSALTGVFVSGGATRAVVAVGGATMTLGAAYAMFRPAQRGA